MWWVDALCTNDANSSQSSNDRPSLSQQQQGRGRTPGRTRLAGAGERTRAGRARATAITARPNWVGLVNWPHWLPAETVAKMSERGLCARAKTAALGAC